ncbi:EAL domain-containing protein [Halorhodospira halophila]|uniref:EAL domain-containing protein n=1 Tax=Halorhodospira halophila TaxID=1053 RepID=UPI001914AECC|nr:EAL domain-containing protein [Halorhodospira halophila]MBK5937124.1 diguanylate cyclase [Halorhodospira halophila]
MDNETPVTRLMHAGILHCSPETPLNEAANRMAAGGKSAIVVLDDEDRAIGIWTEHDALTVDFSDPCACQVPIREAMSSPVETVPSQTSIGEAASAFREGRRRHALVVDTRERPIGIISRTDVVLNLGLAPYLRLREVRSVMRTEPLVLPDTLPLADAAARMRESAWEAAVVAAPGDELGIITERDLVRCVADYPGSTVIGALASRPLLQIEADALLIRARSLFFHNQVRHLAVTDEQGSVAGLLGLNDLLVGTEQLHLKDLQSAIEQRDEAISESRINARLAQRLIESSREAVMITSAEGYIEYINDAFVDLTGYSNRDVIGRTPSLLASGRHAQSFFSDMWQSIHEQGAWEGDIWNRRKTGELYLASLNISAVRNDRGQTVNYVGQLHDVTEIRDQQERLRRQAYYDPLTRLPNRRLIEERLPTIVTRASREGGHIGIVIIDLDGFKQVNDSLNHDSGDRILQELAGRMNETLGEADELGRLAGDEFIAIIAPGGDHDGVVRRARRLMSAVNAPLGQAGQHFRIGCSVGIAIYPDDGEEANALIQHASTALRRAKHEGRNTLRLYRAEMHEAIHQRLALESDLRGALENDAGLEVWYQPLFTSAHHRLAHLEALVRWRHPQQGLIALGTFVPLAEQAGLMRSLGDWVLDAVCRQLATWREQGLSPPPVAVNLSAQQLWVDDLVSRVRDRLDHHQLPSQCLSFELTESAFLAPDQNPTGVLRGLREIPCEVAIDDFGTGYSSLSYLHELPANTLKIDRAFIRGLAENRNSRAIVAAITSLARELGMKVVAEGVETAEQLAALEGFPVDLVQGFLLGRPTPAEDVEQAFLTATA